jgi:NitT/TauT family transport system ATP-binding protein
VRAVRLMAGEGFLRFEGLGMAYARPDQEPLEAIHRVDEAVERGRFVSIVGPSGCGKSTLLLIGAGLVRPSSGRVRLAGQEITRPERSIGMVFQEDSTLPWRTVLDNVRFGLEIAGASRSEQLKRAQPMIELVGLAGFEQAKPAALSGGMRQRVPIARTLALDPDVLLMDEPFAALDQQTRLLLGAELVRIWQATEKTVLFVTHDIQEAVLLSQEVWVMSYRPATILDHVPVDLPYPRGIESVATPEFNAISNRVWKTIQSESKRAFSESPHPPAALG